MIALEIPKKEKSLATGFLKPIVIFKNPSFFRQRLLFQIEKLTKDSFYLSAKMTHDYKVLSDLKEVIFEFPTVGKVQHACSVRKEKEKIILQIPSNQQSTLFKKLLTEYLFKFSPGINLSTLKNYGIPLHSIRNLVEYDIVSTDDEMEEVVQLRLDAYGETEKITDSSEFISPFDELSKVIVAKHNGRIIASCRLFFPKTDETQIEHQLYDVKFPTNFPENSTIVEMMRLCTDKNYRKSDLLFGLLEFAGILTVKENRKFVLGCAERRLLPLYDKLGFKNTGIYYQNTDLNSVEHGIILLDVEKVKKGKMNPISWNMIWGEAVQSAQEDQLILNKGLSRFRVEMYHRLRPLTNRLYEKYLRRK